ncbi:SidA/IucD/PvdA family monooxygenase [Bradyrhizobium sp. ORS 375]|uniref:SidA/IucD/PvdA family monooxygenase n=1 Tax=Bradyrhizobium sp. (strain ORS 375) TaxID=566679 RepID=UPI0002F7A00B|nr:SidA/IucD/PvdA family monooxygenase [Bradyrhizobium sp. ORS 375]
MDAVPGQKRVDLACVGFGPSGIALAAAIEECGDNRDPTGLTSRFFEARTSSAWHPNFILAGSDINHHFLRDLATPRDPRSQFTFVNYLKTNGRLYDFGRLGRAPSRQEWSDYVQWVAAQLAANVSYCDPVQQVRPRFEGDELVELSVDARSGPVSTTNLVVSVGAEPTIPTVFRSLMGDRVFHTSEYERRILGLPKTPRSIVVIGAGQSAGEAIFDLRQRFPNSSIIGIQRSSGFKLYDLSQFSNAVYCPPETDYFYGLPPSRKSTAFAETVRTNYSGLDAEICSALYQQVYEDAVARMPRITLLTRRAVSHVQASASAISLSVKDVNSDAAEVITSDAVVLATGFHVNPLPGLLQNMRSSIRMNEWGQPLVNRDYSLSLSGPSRVRIYLNGLCEHSHGIGDGQSFSMVALRAEAIVRSVLRSRDSSAERHDQSSSPELVSL